MHSLREVELASRNVLLFSTDGALATETLVHLFLTAKRGGHVTGKTVSNGELGKATKFTFAVSAPFVSHSSFQSSPDSTLSSPGHTLPLVVYASFLFLSAAFHWVFLILVFNTTVWAFSGRLTTAVNAKVKIKGASKTCALHCFLTRSERLGLARQRYHMDGASNLDKRTVLPSF